MDEIVFKVKESGNGGYEASAIDHAIFTEAENWSDLQKNIKEAVVCHSEEPVGYFIQLH